MAIVFDHVNVWNIPNWEYEPAGKHQGQAWETYVIAFVIDRLRGMHTLSKLS